MLKNNFFSTIKQNSVTIAPTLPMPDYRTLNPIGHQEQMTSPRYAPKSTMKRIVIIGSSGSGKSTLARQLGKPK